MMRIIKSINEKCYLTKYNSLIILNKIDEQTDRKYIMREFSKNLMKELGDIIYDDSNTILGLDSISFKKENLAESNIYNLINYYKNTLKDKDDNDALLKKIKEVLFETFNSQNKEFKDFDNFLKSKSEKLEAEEEKKLLNFIEELGFSIDDNENQEINYFKSLCTCLAEKIINIHMTKEKEEIINYFTKSKNDKSKYLYNNNEEINQEDKILFEKINLMTR
jgi:hypothetical protein